MRLKLYTVIAICFMLVLNSCTERIDIKPSELELHIAVEATLTNEVKAHAVKITSTKLITDTIVPPISNATVIINDGSVETMLTESDTIPGLYLTPDSFACESGKNYHLKITDVDIDMDGVTELYEAFAVMPDAIGVDSVTTEPFNIETFEFEGWSLKCWAWDPPEENYYLFKAWKNDTLLSDTLYEYNFTDDVYFNGQFTNGIECQVLDQSKEDEVVRDGDVLALELCHISKDFYDFLVGVSIESRPKVPMFSGPPANVPSNISNGALGFFRVYYTVKKSDTVVFEVDGK